MFPKQFLSPHFWSIQQRVKFTTDMLQDRLYHQRSVFRFMQSRLEVLRNDDTAFRQMRLVLGRLGAGQHPSVEDVVALTTVMSRPPYNLESLPQNVLVSVILHWIRYYGSPIIFTFYLLHPFSRCKVASVRPARHPSRHWQALAARLPRLPYPSHGPGDPSRGRRSQYAAGRVGASVLHSRLEHI